MKPLTLHGTTCITWNHLNYMEPPALYGTTCTTGNHLYYTEPPVLHGTVVLQLKPCDVYMISNKTWANHCQGQDHLTIWLGAILQLGDSSCYSKGSSVTWYLNDLNNVYPSYMTSDLHYVYLSYVTSKRLKQCLPILCNI